jgi:hypothetical protein
MKNTIKILILFVTLGAVIFPAELMAGYIVLEHKAIETYRVLKVVGNVTLEKNNHHLIIGDLFDSNDQLKFNTAGAQVAVVTSSRRRKIFTASTKSSKQSLLQTPSQNNVLMRNSGIINSQVLSNYFKDTILLLNNLKLQIEVSGYYQDQKQFYYLEYLHKGEAIAKKLAYENHELIIYRDSLFMIDGLVVNHENLTDITLKFRRVESNSSEDIGSFVLSTPNMTEIRAQLDIFTAQWTDPKMENEAMMDQITSHLKRFYGKTNDGDVKRFYGL